MKPGFALSILATLLFCTGVPCAQATGDEGIALAIIYDTSGSMHDPVPSREGKPTAKYVIANRALTEIAHELRTFVASGTNGSPRRLDAGLFIFKGNGTAEAIPFGPFVSTTFEDWAARFHTPSGNTPLSTSLVVAANCLLKSPLARKHILVITDGMNTVGPQPSTVWPRLKRRAEKKGTSLSVHFVAFDVAASVFAPLMNEGATVVSAADERQLSEQLDFILQRKILLEDEEPPRNPGKSQ